MAVAHVKKVIIFTNKKRTKNILEEIQKIGFCEVKPYKRGENGFFPSDKEVSEKISLFKNTIDIIAQYRGILGFITGAGKIPVTRDEFDSIKQRMDLADVAEQILKLNSEALAMKEQVRELRSEINHIHVWKDYKGLLEDIGKHDKYTLILGKFNEKSLKFKEIEEKLKDKPVSLELLSSNGEIAYILIAYHNKIAAEMNEFLAEIEFEEGDFKNYKGSVEDNMVFLRESLISIEEKRKGKEEYTKLLIEKFEKQIYVYYEYLKSINEMQESVLKGFATEKVDFFSAWTKSENIIKLKEKEIDFLEIEPEAGEDIPIILENNKFVQPFELVTNLYGVPRYFEIDPTPYIAVFFAMFFGLCITDAAYGIIIAIAAGIAAYKFKNMRQFMLLFMMGGIWTTIMGALFSGWFGDLPSYLGAEKFFSKFALLGDPIKSMEGSMNFFRLALLLGVIHVFFGLGVKFYDCVKKKDFAAAFFDSFVWITFIGSLVIMFLTTDIAIGMDIVKAPIVSKSIVSILGIVILISVIIIVLFAQRAEKNWVMRIFMGVLNATILGGVTSYVGDFLSYIRLMALGLTSAGIGVAINKIAFTMTGIPYVGIVVTVIILIGGHTFNLAISLLGAFVHTLRLHFVEFFNKFYAGGGTAFRPFKEDFQYIVIIDETNK